MFNDLKLKLILELIIEIVFIWTIDVNGQYFILYGIIVISL